MAVQRVLLVEHHRPFRITFSKLLSKLAACEVIEASTPEDARKLPLSQAGIQLVVTHIHFPDGKGDRDYKEAAEFCRMLRATLGNDIPIIGLRSTEVDVKFLADVGFPADIIPFNVDFDRPKDFIQRVKEALHGTRV